MGDLEEGEQEEEGCWHQPDVQVGDVVFMWGDVVFIIDANHCFLSKQGALPAKGKEYPGLGYKRLQDKPPKAQEQQPAEAHAEPSSVTQLLRLQNFGAQDRALQQFFKKLEEDMAEVSMERHGSAKQLVVFFGAASIGTRGGWGADAVLRACRKVVCRPRGPDQDGGRVVLVDESQLSMAPRKPPQAPRSNQAATQPAASEQGPSTPPPAKRSKRNKAEQAAEPTQPTKGKTKGKAAKAKPGPQPGRWLDRDCNAALNMQRIGESKWRPLELCWWPEQGKLPAKGKEYPGLGVQAAARQATQGPAGAPRCGTVVCGPPI
ncbi:hypothetical protein QJQ45_000546 [Haematococcus lacustris]|nr:hypothetical protein QJQ45_000546 [Haematococcus lacustris]